MERQEGSGTDAVFVGGGFAGVTAARELTMRGRTAVLVEARDRLGGRTYTSDHDGHAMELGGTWVHPCSRTPPVRTKHDPPPNPRHRLAVDLFPASCDRKIDREWMGPS